MAGTFRPRTEIDRSAPTGYCEAPPELILVPRRMIEPPAQRRPSPNVVPAPPAMRVVPWKYSAELFGMFVPRSASVSLLMLDEPVAARLAPAALIECAQPLPAAPELPHGQAVPLPSPKQKASGALRTCMRTNAPGVPKPAPFRSAPAPLRRLTMP